jgi:hypothetical protein
MEFKYKGEEKQKEYSKEYYLKNKEKIKKYREEYFKNNKEKIKLTRQKNKEYNNFYTRKKKKTDFLFKLKINTRSLILNTIKRQGYSKKSKTFEILGCSYEEFKNHIERQFIKGMNWQNHGEWHFDHIYPVSLAKNEEELIKLNHYTNFQPLWKKDNLEKRNKIIPNTQIKLI